MRRCARFFVTTFSPLIPPLAAAPTPQLYAIAGAAGGPTDEETLYVELINRARRSPAAEAERLRRAPEIDPAFRSSYTFFKVDPAMLAAELAALPPVPPLAFNAALLNMARAHSQDMFAHELQGHTGSNGSSITDRARAAGYVFTRVAENVYSHAKSVPLGHASFEVDWGDGPGGMQPSRGHRANLHDPGFREIGVGVKLGTKGSVGPQLVTQNFGNRLGLFPLLTGVVYFDFDGDRFYSLGEGLGGVGIAVEGGDFRAVTTDSGAFTIPLRGNGTHHVAFSGLGFNQTAAAIVEKGTNVKLDFSPPYAAPVLSGPETVTVGSSAHYTFAAIAGATAYERVSYRALGADPREPAESILEVTVAVSPGYAPLQRRNRAEGDAAFVLRHLQPADQTLTLRRRVYVETAAATLSFASLLGAAGDGEQARVQVSVDEGATWADVYTQAGSGRIGERTFTNRRIGLGVFAGRVIQMRFVYAFTEGTFIRGEQAGWFIDDLRFQDCLDLVDRATETVRSAAAVSFTAAAAGDYLVGLRPFNHRRALPMGPLLRVSTRSATHGP